MLPIYLFYSMFGFQRTGDLTWLLGDMRGRGILAGCTAGRTTLQGEGLQHDDGHSPLLASVNPAARIYDPAFAYEIAVIVEEAVRTTIGPEPEDRFWYLTLYNENYVMPALPSGDEGDAVRAGILRGMYQFAPPASKGPDRNGQRRATLLFSGPLWQAAMEARARVGHALGCRRRRLVGDVVHHIARRRPVGRTLQPAPSRRGGPDALRHRCARWSRWPGGGRERLHAGRSPTRWPAGSHGPLSHSGPTASDDPTPAARCDGSSRSTPATSWWPCCPPWRRWARPRPTTSTEAIAMFEIDADSVNPWTL